MGRRIAAMFLTDPAYPGSDEADQASQDSVMLPPVGGLRASAVSHLPARRLRFKTLRRVSMPHAGTARLEILSEPGMFAATSH
jgi:hypothetical protein